jgi:saxitoxin biosynthesis operon SxtJ-like protein
MHSNFGSPRSGHRAEREFGLIVGSVFVLLAGWWLYRGKLGLIAYGFLGVGIVLVVLGAVFPRALTLPSRMWMALSEVLSFVSTRVILVIVFFVVITPTGVARRLFGWDPLRRRAASAQSYWKPYGARQRDRRHYEKMF